MTNSEIGVRIKHRREQLGLTQQQIADAISVTKSTIQRYETGKIEKIKIPVMSMVKMGEVTHYFPHVKAAALLVLKDSIKVGDEIYIKGHTTDFKEKIKSMQIDCAQIREGKKGQEIGLLVKKRVRIGDSVYRL